jgi:putative FmdB family regulatory protein
MPTYEYECDACGHAFDEFQSFKDDPLKVCPKCGKESLRRLFGTGAAILFKGAGFYETDYRSDSYKQAAKADQDSGKASAPADGKKADSKPAAEVKSSDTKSSSPTPSPSSGSS